MTTHSTMKHQALAAAMTDLAGVGDMDGVPERQERGKRERKETFFGTDKPNEISVLSVLCIRKSQYRLAVIFSVSANDTTLNQSFLKRAYNGLQKDKNMCGVSEET